MKNIICYLWKHNITFNDNGCDICERCGKHEYYDKDFHNGKPFFKVYFWLRLKYLRLKTWYEIKYCNKLPF